MPNLRVTSCVFPHFRFDQIEVSLDDDGDHRADAAAAAAATAASAASASGSSAASSSSAVVSDRLGAPVSNAVDFLAENNDCYDVGWEEAARRISEADEDPSKSVEFFKQTKRFDA